MGEPLSRGNRLDVGTVPLASYLPFLFGDKTAPAAPAAPTVTRSGQAVTLTWTSGSEADLAGYDVFRTVAGGTAEKISASYGGLVGRAEYTDAAAPAGATYMIQAVDTSGNRSVLSPAVGSEPPVPTLPAPG